MEQLDPCHLFDTIYKHNSRNTKDLNIRGKNIKISKDNTGEHIDDLGKRKDSLSKT